MAAIYLKYKRKSNEFFTKGKTYTAEQSTKDKNQILLINDKGIPVSFSMPSLHQYFEESVCCSKSESESTQDIDVAPLELGGFVEIACVKHKVIVDQHGYYFRVSGPDVLPNDFIFRHLEITDKYAYVGNIVKYIVNSGIFPYVKSLKDLAKVANQLDKDYKEKFAIQKVDVTSPKLGESIILGSTEYCLKQNDYGFFLFNIQKGWERNSKMFEELGISDKCSYVSEIIGYKCGEGIFPTVKSLEDLIKVIAQLKKDYEEKSKNAEAETPKPTFKIGDWVIFDVEKAKGTRFYTSVWNKPYVLQISGMLSGHPQFSKERMIAAGCDDSILSSTCGNSVTLFRHATPEEIEKATKPKVETPKKESIPIGSYVVITEASGILESQDKVGQVLKLIAINPLSDAKYICEDVFGRYNWTKGDFLSDYGVTTSAKSCCKEVRLATEDDITFVKRDLKSQERSVTQSTFLQGEIKSDVPKKVSFRDFLKSL